MEIDRGASSPRIIASTARSRRALLIGGLLAVAAAVGGGYYYMTQSKAAKATPPKVEVPAATTATMTPPAPATDKPAPTPAPAVEPPKTEPAPPAATQAKPFKPLDEIDRIFQLRSRDYSVAVELEQAQVRIGRDMLRFRLRSNKSGYLYILMVGTDRQHFYKLFPNSVHEKNRVEAGKEITLPRTGWVMVADGPPGSDQFVAVVSENPRDFADSGMIKVDPFGEFPLETAPSVVSRHTGSQSPFIGKVACANGAADCGDAYGAAVFTIYEVAAGDETAKPRAAQRPKTQAFNTSASSRKSCSSCAEPTLTRARAND